MDTLEQLLLFDNSDKGGSYSNSQGMKLNNGGHFERDEEVDSDSDSDSDAGQIHDTSTINPNQSSTFKRKIRSSLEDCIGEYISRSKEVCVDLVAKYRLEEMLATAANQGNSASFTYNPTIHHCNGFSVIDQEEVILFLNCFSENFLQNNPLLHTGLSSQPTNKVSDNEGNAGSDKAMAGGGLRAEEINLLKSKFYQKFKYFNQFYENGSRFNFFVLVNQLRDLLSLPSYRNTLNPSTSTSTSTSAASSLTSSSRPNGLAASGSSDPTPQEKKKRYHLFLRNSKKRFFYCGQCSIEQINHDINQKTPISPSFPSSSLANNTSSTASLNKLLQTNLPQSTASGVATKVRDYVEFLFRLVDFDENLSENEDFQELVANHMNIICELLEL